MINLPFLKRKGWPKLRKMAGESRYGFSEDEELIEHMIDELMSAFESKDNKKFYQALSALIDAILNKESGDAIDAQKNANSIQA